MGRYDYDDMPSASNGRRGRGSRTTALVALICILLVLIGIVIYLILFSPSTTATVQENTSDSSQNANVVSMDVTLEVSPTIEEAFSEEIAPEIELPVEEPDVIEEIPTAIEAVELSVGTEEEVGPVSDETLDVEVGETIDALEAVVEPISEESIISEELPIDDVEVLEEPTEEEIVEVEAPEEVLKEPSAEEEEALESVESDASEDSEEVVLPIPFVDAETLHDGLLEVLSRMNLDPIPVAEEEEISIEPEPVPEIVEIEEVIIEEPVFEVPVVEEEPEVMEEQIFASYDFACSLENARLTFDEENAVLTGKAGQGVKSIVSGNVYDTGKFNGEKFIDILTEEGRTIRYIGFERVSVKKNQQVSEGTVLGSIGSSSRTPYTIIIVVFDSDGSVMKLNQSL